MSMHLRSIYLTVLCASLTFTPLPQAFGDSGLSLRPPVTADNDTTILLPPPFVQPAPVELPTKDDLSTITIRNRTVTVTRVARGVRTPKVAGAAPKAHTAI